jgi:protein CpxP
VVIVAGVLVLAITAGAGWVQAFGPGGHGGHGGGFGGLKMLMQLDLTDAQKARIRDMLPAYRAEKDAREEALQAMRQQMRALMEADRFDENEVRQALREMAPLVEDMAVSRVRFMHDIKAVLTSEQIARIADRHMQRENRRGEHRRVRESMLDTWLSTPAGSASAQ